MAISSAWKKHLRAALLLGAIATQSALAVPVLSTAAVPSPATAGASVTANVLISDIADLYAYQFSIAFNPSILQALSVTEGPFLAAGGTTFFDGGTIDNAAGTISFLFDTLIGAVPGVGGSGVLLRIGFGTIAPGTSALAFSDVSFIKLDLSDIAVQVQNGSVQVVPEPATAALFGAGLIGLAGWAARRRRSTKT